jgi:hypothetical protein
VSHHSAAPRTCATAANKSNQNDAVVPARSRREELPTGHSSLPTAHCFSCVRLKYRGRVAQLVEQCPFKAWVAGSNPAALTTPSNHPDPKIIDVIPKRRSRRGTRCLLAAPQLRKPTATRVARTLLSAQPPKSKLPFAMAVTFSDLPWWWPFSALGSTCLRNSPPLKTAKGEAAEVRGGASGDAKGWPARRGVR